MASSLAGRSIIRRLYWNPVNRYSHNKDRNSDRTNLAEAPMLKGLKVAAIEYSDANVGGASSRAVFQECQIVP